MHSSTTYTKLAQNTRTLLSIAELLLDFPITLLRSNQGRLLLRFHSFRPLPRCFPPSSRGFAC